jgi:dihydrodipicolinate synthase/N-acetylneuraminate lyase
MGTAGEGYALTDRRFQQVVQIFWEEMQQPGMYPMVGVISLSMGEILERIAWAHDMGIRHFQISFPSWGALSDSEMMTFFQAVCGAFPDSQFLHYNLPRTKRVVTGGSTGCRCRPEPAPPRIPPAICAVADLMTHTPDLQHVFVENAFAMGCLFGECSLLPSYGLLFPKLANRHFEAGRARSTAELMELHKQIGEIVPKLFGHISEPRIDGARQALRLAKDSTSCAVSPPRIQRN